MKNPTLVIMAAGIGSRFGGIKQLEPVDNQGHPIIDFSLFDAWRAGFRDVAFIIRRDIEKDFRECIGNHVEPYFNVSYIFQDLDRLPEGFEVPDVRKRPWGTGHAIACVKGVVDGPFAVINADDFYGPTAFSTIYDYLKNNADAHAYAMVGYRVRNTVTEHGSVSRGVCEVENGMLTTVTERLKIYKRGTDAAYTEDGGETFVHLPGDTIVSMNLWGFTPQILDRLWSGMPAFLEKGIASNPEKCEYLLPSVVNDQISDGTAVVNVLPCEETWYGVTYREDLESVRSAIRTMKDNGIYEEELWK